MIESKKLSKREVSILQSEYDADKNLIRGFGYAPFIFFSIIGFAIVSNSEKNFDEKFMIISFLFLFLGIWFYVGSSALFKMYELKKDIKNGIKYCGYVSVNEKKIYDPDESPNSYYFVVTMYTGFIKVYVTEADFHLVDLHSKIYLEILPKSKMVLTATYKEKTFIYMVKRSSVKVF